MKPLAPFEPERILRALVEQDVAFLVIGGLAATIHGSSSVTRDLDIIFERSLANRQRLAAALRLLDARPRFPDIDESLATAQDLDDDSMFAFATRYGALDCFGWPPSDRPYAELRANAERVAYEDYHLWIISLDDLIDLKREAGRPKDLIAVSELEALRQLRTPTPPDPDA